MARLNLGNLFATVGQVYGAAQAGRLAGEQLKYQREQDIQQQMLRQLALQQQNEERVYQRGRDALQDQRFVDTLARTEKQRQEDYTRSLRDKTASEMEMDARNRPYGTQLGLRAAAKYRETGEYEPVSGGITIPLPSGPVGANINLPGSPQALQARMGPTKDELNDGRDGALRRDIAAIRATQEQEQEKRLRQSQAEAQYARLRTSVTNAAKSGNPRQALAAIRSLNAWVAQQPAEYGFEPIGGFDDTPQSVRRKVSVSTQGLGQLPGQAGAIGGLVAGAVPSVPGEVDGEETPEEVQARQLRAASEFVDDPKEKSKYLREGFNLLRQTVTGTRWQQMSETEQTGVLERLHEYADELGIPNPLPPGFSAKGLTPYQQSLMKEREESRKLREQQGKDSLDLRKQQVALAKERLGIARANLGLAQGRDRREEEKFRQAAKAVEKLDPVTKERAMLLRSRIARLEGQINTNQIKGYFADAEALYDDLEGLIAEYDVLLDGAGVGATARPGVGDLKARDEGRAPQAPPAPVMNRMKSLAGQASRQGLIDTLMTKYRYSRAEAEKKADSLGVR